MLDMNMKLLKRKLRFNRKKYYLYTLLGALLLSLGIGYSYLRTSVMVNGVSKLNNSKWDIYFDNNSINVDSGSVTPITEVTSTKTNLNFSARLENSGDYYSFTIDVVNNGTIDASLGNITLTPTLTTEQSKYLTFNITYDDDTPLNIGDSLSAGSSKTLKVVARYNNGLDVDDYPIIDEAYDFSLQLNYSQ